VKNDKTLLDADEKEDLASGTDDENLSLAKLSKDAKNGKAFWGLVQ
jgi:hypothetical protein